MTRPGSYRKHVPRVLTAALLLSTATAGFAQNSFEDTIRQFDADDVRGYLQPVADLFGANMLSGFYGTAAIPADRVRFGFELVAMGALVGDKHRTYLAKSPPGFSPATFETATVLGGQGATVRHAADASLSYRGSDGLIDATLLPLAVPQIRIGGVAGSELIVRGLAAPELGDGDFPSMTLVGIGVRHGIGRYLGAVPVDLAVGVFFNSFKAGEIVEFTGLGAGVQASRSFSPLTVYGGLGWEKSTLSVTYASTDPNSPPVVDLSFDGANSFRATAGTALGLGFAGLFADVSFGSVTAFAAGLRVGS